MHARSSAAPAEDHAHSGAAQAHAGTHGPPQAHAAGAAAAATRARLPRQASSEEPPPQQGRQDAVPPASASPAHPSRHRHRSHHHHSSRRQRGHLRAERPEAPADGSEAHARRVQAAAGAPHECPDDEHGLRSHRDGSSDGHHRHHRQAGAGRRHSRRHRHSRHASPRTERGPDARVGGSPARLSHRTCSGPAVDAAEHDSTEHSQHKHSGHTSSHNSVGATAGAGPSGGGVQRLGDVRGSLDSPVRSALHSHGRVPQRRRDAGGHEIRTQSEAPGRPAAHHDTVGAVVVAVEGAEVYPAGGGGGSVGRASHRHRASPSRAEPGHRGQGCPLREVSHARDARYGAEGLFVGTQLTRPLHAGPGSDLFVVAPSHEGHAVRSYGATLHADDRWQMDS